MRDHGDRDRVRDASDIVSVVGQHVALKARGREYMGLCPFHDDHKPSMHVVPSKQIFHCFVCGAGGDVFSFVQKFHGMEFREAMEFLAARAGIELRPRPDPASRAEGEPGPASYSRADLVRANTVAAEFFRLILRRDDLGAVGREALGLRGISAEMIDQFQIGVSPDRWDGLIATARGKGLEEPLLVAAGLARRRESGPGCYDTFRHRLMFPIHDQIGRVIAFGGRRLRDEEEAKYVNSPESALFDKSATLYGLHRAARPIQAARVAVVAEGYTDVIACHQAGITNVVGVLGTALTVRHAALLRRLCGTVVLLFDADDAGRRAADRALEAFLREDIDVLVASLDPAWGAKDPDELLRRPGGADLLRRAIDSARDLLLVRFDRMKAGLAGGGVSAITRAVQEELARMVELGLLKASPIKRQLVLRRLTELSGVNAEAIIAARPADRPARTQSADQPAPAEAAESGGGTARPGSAPRSPGRLSEHEILLGCVLCEPGILPRVVGREEGPIDVDRFADADTAEVARWVHEIEAHGGAASLDAVLAATESVGAKAAAVRLAETVRAMTEGSAVRLGLTADDCLARLSRRADPAPSSAAERLARARAQHATTGGDRRVVPRP